MAENADDIFTKEEQTLIKLTNKLPRKLLQAFATVMVGYVLYKKKMSVVEINERLIEAKKELKKK